MFKPLGDFPIRPNDFPYHVFRWLGKVADTVRKIETYSPALTPSAFSTTTDEQDFTIVGLSVNDVITVNKPDHQTGVSIGNSRVSAKNTLSITFVNQTGGNITPSAGTYLVQAVRI